MNNVLTKRKVKILDNHYILEVPENVKISEISNNNLLAHLKNNYSYVSDKVLIQGGCFGIYGVFFEKEFKRDVKILEADPVTLKISEKNLISNNCKNTIYDSKVINAVARRFDIYTSASRPLSSILEESDNGIVTSFMFREIEKDIGFILINNCVLKNTDSLLQYLDTYTKNEKQLIVIKKNCVDIRKKYKNLKLIDDHAGYVFYSKTTKKHYSNSDPINEVQVENGINEILNNIKNLKEEISEIKVGNYVHVNFFNVINHLRPSLEKGDLLMLEKIIDDIINAYEKEIYNLNKTIAKRNNKINTLLNSNTWKYTQFARNRLGFDKVTFSDYLGKNEHIESLDQEAIRKLRSEILNIANKQNKINTTLIDVIDKNPNVIESSKHLNAISLSPSQSIVGNTNLIESKVDKDLMFSKKNIEDKRFNKIKHNHEHQKKFAGLAAIPSRELALKRVVSSLVHQVDQLGVYLNGWDYIPDFLNHSKIVVAMSQNHGDLGDAGKFFWINDFEGYYFSCDDDLVYPDDYTQRIIEKIKYYDYKAVVGWHGSVVSDSFKDYYDPKDRRVFSYSAGRPFDLDVHILGTGVLGFHSSTIKVSLQDFEKPNMADIFFARLGQEQKVKFVVMEHKSKEIETIEEFQEDSINKHGQQQIESAKNVRKYKNDISTSLNWRLNNSQALKILLIGRFDNFKKGGIHKSNLLIEKYLKQLGHEVYTIDSQSTNFEVMDHKVDVAMVYPGDPNRPDFSESIQKMELLRKIGVPILLNMSYNSNPVRSKLIAKTIESYNQEKFKSKVCLMAFSESMKFDAHLESIRKYIISFPKTIDVDNTDLDIPNFNNREGIFFGDATKLNNPEITDGKVINWVSEARKRMPKTNFYVIKHYSGKFDLPNFEFAPFMESADLMRWISSRRLSICLNQFTTYEMVPVESQSVGTPVIYRSMLQSLNEAIGLTGVPVTEPSIFGEMCQWLYNDETAWQEYSRLSLLNFKRNHIDACRIGLETALRKVILINGVE